MFKFFYATLSIIIFENCEQMPLLHKSLYESRPAGSCHNYTPRALYGMTLTPWEKGSCLVWDATCADTLANSYIKSTSKEAGRAAETAAKKNNKYSPGRKEFHNNTIGGKKQLHLQTK